MDTIAQNWKKDNVHWMVLPTQSKEKWKYKDLCFLIQKVIYV